MSKDQHRKSSAQLHMGSYLNRRGEKKERKKSTDKSPLKIYSAMISRPQIQVTDRPRKSHIPLHISELRLQFHKHNETTTNQQLAEELLSSYLCIQLQVVVVGKHSCYVNPYYLVFKRTQEDVYK